VSEGQGPGQDVLVSLNRAATTARLMAGAVHEVNNALQVIAGSVELLEQNPDLSPGAARSLDRIKRQSERAAAALAELQVFTRAPLDGRERFNLREVVRHSLSLRRYAAARAGIAVELLDENTDLGLAIGNPGYVQQAVLNLLINAEQAMTGRDGVVRVTIRRDAERAGVAVADAGAGLSAEATSRLFQPFVTTKAPGDGAGLGLWVTRAIAESFGGTVEVESTAAGTTVTLWLPLA
jgi:signal transduction histidine kinase